MARKKVKLAFIPDNSARKASYNKRKKGLIKKVTELTTLCDIPACAIISNPFNSQAEVWPNPEGAKKVIERYQNSFVVDETRNLSHERFIMQRIVKSRDKLRKLKHDTREQKLNLLIFENLHNNNLPDDLIPEDLKDLEKLIEKKLKEVNDKIDTVDW